MQLYPGEPHGRDLAEDPGGFVGREVWHWVLILDNSSSLASPSIEEIDTLGAEEADFP